MTSEKTVEEIVDKKLKQISNYIFGRSISLQDSAKYERQVWIDTLTQDRAALHTSLVAAVEELKEDSETPFGTQELHETELAYNQAIDDTLTIINSIFKE